jgi:hypothetical protein
LKRLACVALLAALPAYAQPAPKEEVFAKFSHWARSVGLEGGSAFIARTGSSELVGPQLAIKDAAGSDYHGAAIAIVGGDNQAKPLKAGFRTGERFKLRVLTTFAAHVVVENINARDERRQIYPAPSAGVVVVQSGGYVLLPLGAKEFFEFTKATGQELLVVSLSHPRAVGDAASRQPVLRVDEKDGTSFIQEVAKGKFPAILEPIRLEHR